MICVPESCKSKGDLFVSEMYEIRIYRETYLFTTKLDVSENFIVTLPADGLSSVQVQTVRLTRNTLRHISTAAFRGLVAVKQLDLALKVKSKGRVSPRSKHFQGLP